LNTTSKPELTIALNLSVLEAAEVVGAAVVEAVGVAVAEAVGVAVAEAVGVAVVAVVAGAATGSKPSPL
jgi:hypothetical protein